MSNIAYITTRKHVKSYDILSLIQQINQKRFDGKLEIEKSNYCWNVKYQGLNDWLEFYKDSPRKLSCKAPHHPWMSYIFVVFRQELAVLTGGILSDEGVEEHWKPTPKKYSSWKKWLMIIHNHIKDEKMLNNIVENEFLLAPKGMEKY